MLKYNGERKVSKFGKVKCIPVIMTEKAVMERPDYIYEGKEVYWIEKPEDEYGWHHYANHKAVKVYRYHWINGAEC